MHSTRETYEKEANELHSEEALEDPNVQSDTGRYQCMHKR